MITCRDLEGPSRVPRDLRPLPWALREAIRSFPGRELLPSLTPFSAEVLDRLAAGEPVRMSPRMWVAVYQLAAIVESRRIALEPEAA